MFKKHVDEGSPGVMVGLTDFKGICQPSWFYDSDSKAH